jgi:hypothetical protein
MGRITHTLIIDDGTNEESHQELPDGEAIEHGGDKTRWRKQLGGNRRIGGWGDETPCDIDHDVR